MKLSQTLYSEITRYPYNNYTGFRPSQSWKPQELQTIPTSDELVNYVNHRIPFIVRGSSLKTEENQDPLKSLLDWDTSSWINDPKYLINQVNHDRDPDDDDFTVLVERRKSPKSNSSPGSKNSLFGFGVNVHNTHIPFVEFLENYFCYNNEVDSSECSKKIHSDWVEYLNVQDLRDTNGSIWRPPLSLPSLRKDIPIPSFLQQFIAAGTLSDINLWMGNTFENQGRTLNCLIINSA